MTTLALNMIIGPGEAGLLRRCLMSVKAKENFDEIVLVPTTHDEQVKAVCDEYNSKETIFFDWASEEFPYGNFGGARQCALDNSSSDYVMWLDADDVVFEENYAGMKNLFAQVRKEERANIEAYFLPYDIAHDAATLKPLITFLRERIFKRQSKFFWRHPVHELLYENDWAQLVTAKVNGTRISHAPNKVIEASGTRNVKILEYEMTSKGSTDFHTRYFCGRDMMISGRVAEGVAIMEKLTTEIDQHSPINLYAICQELLFFYAYGNSLIRPAIDQIKSENAMQIERWGRTALSFMQSHAEPFCILGDLAFRHGEKEQAMRLWKQSMKQKVGAGMMQLIPFYEEIPAKRIAMFLEDVGDYEQALYYNKISRLHNNTSDMLGKRKLYLYRMLELDEQT